VPLDELLRTEARYAVLESTNPERAAALQALAQSDVEERWRYYEQLAGVERTRVVGPDDEIEETAP
jgi:pyruvate-ferredoxin/flavodoxin oxidoreductase